MKKNIYLLGLLLLAACANDDEPTGQQVQNTYPLTIEVTENPLIPDGEEGSSTRAAITDNSSFATFYLNYQYNSVYLESEAKQTITKTSGTWSGGSWPSDAGEGHPEVNVTWYAYTDGTFNCTDENPYVRFTVEELATNQKDLLVAKLTNKTWNNCGGNLNFTFDHACAALRFYVKKASNISSNTLSVSSVVLKHVAKQGKYYFNAMAWTPITTESTDFTDYSLYKGEDKDITSTSSYTRLNGTNEDDSYLFLIPQELVGNVSTGTYVEIAWKSNYGSHESGTARIPLSKVLEKGYKYDVKINIGKTTLTTHSGY